MKFVKYTSIGLIIGFGGYACYRLIVKQRPNKNVKLVPKTKPPPFSSEPVAEKDLQTNTMNSSSTLLLKQDKKTDMSSSDISKEIFQPLDSEQLPPKEEFQRQLGENSKPDEDTKHDEDSKPNEDIKPDEDTKPGEDSKLGEDSKPNEDSEPNEDIKPDEDTKPDEDSKLDQPSKPSEDSKPNQDTKPGEDTKPDQDSKPEKESKTDEDSYPKENFKPDELDTNQANGKIENKTIDETNEETEPQVVLSPASDKSYQINQDATINSTSDLDASISIDNKKNSIKETSMLSNDSPSTTNCSLDVCPSTPCSSPLDVSELEGETTTGSVDNYLTQRSFSMTSQSSVIGEGMVAKLEQLLHQAGNLAESVGEMNADVATLRRIEPKLLSIAGDSISLGEETNCDSMIINGKDETSQTPSLEWDSNGINLVSEPDSNYSTIKEEDESLLNESLLGDISLSDKSGLLSPISSASLNSSIEPSFLKSTLGDITGQSDSLEHNEKEIISLNFSTSDANENFNESKSIAQSNGSLSVDK